MRPNYKVEFASGVFIIMGIGALLWLATAATNLGNQIGDDVYRLKANFASVGKLNPRSPVKIGGVTIGVVESIDLDMNTFQNVVTMKIDQAYDAIPDDSSAAIFTNGLLGDAFIAVEVGGSFDSLADGDSFFLTQSAVALEQLVSKYLFSTGDNQDGEEGGE